MNRLYLYICVCMLCVYALHTYMHIYCSPGITHNVGPTCMYKSYIYIYIYIYILLYTK